MGSIGIPDPSIGLAQTVLGFTLLVVGYQLFVHLLNGIFWSYKKIKGIHEPETNTTIPPESSEPEIAEDNSFLELGKWLLIGGLRCFLALIYLTFLIKLSIVSPTNQLIMDFDSYVGNIQMVLLSQLGLTFIAVLLWISSSHWMRWVIPWGFVLISLSVILNAMVRFFQDSFFHWVQVAEVLLPALIGLIIPSLSFLAFRYLNKLKER